MDSKCYEEFLKYHKMGLRKKASQAIHSFISSFKNKEEVHRWVWSYLQNLESNVEQSFPMRYEIFRDLIFPILKEGYLKDNFECTFWLVKFIQSLYSSTFLHKELNYVSEHQLLRKCYELKPENQKVKKLLLKNIITDLQYSLHEWPSGILYGTNGANLEQCKEIRDSIIFAKVLDMRNEYRLFLEDFCNKLSQYESKLKE